jgi:hypothetical protein
MENLENTEENSKKRLKIWKKPKLKCENDMENMEETQVEICNDMKNPEEKYVE